MEGEIRITVIATGFDGESEDDFELEEPQAEQRSVFSNYGWSPTARKNQRYQRKRSLSHRNS